MTKVLALNITADAAATRAGGPVTLHYYPLTGVEFTVVGGQGPAALIDGHAFRTVVDRATGHVATSEKWRFDIAATELYAPDERGMTIEAATTLGRQALTTKLLRKIRLGSRFGLQVTDIIDPLWKPNWLHRASDGTQILVDGLDGSVARRVG